MNDNLHSLSGQTPARIVAGALAHLATHMASGCERSACLAALLLEKVANDPQADDHLRRHALDLVEILERDRRQESFESQAAGERRVPLPAAHATGAIFGVRA